MTKRSYSQLSRREREIMDVLYRIQRATAQEILSALSDPPSYSAVRTHLRILAEKGHVRHELVGKAYVYSPAPSRAKTGRGALRQVLNTFFEGSAANAVASLLDRSDGNLSDAELARLAELIESARAKEKRA